MRKTSTRLSGISSEGEGRGKAGRPKRNSAGSGSEQQLPASTVETAFDGITSTYLEEGTEEQFALEPTKRNGYLSSSSSSSGSSNSSFGGKILKVFTRKVHSSSGSAKPAGKASPLERTSVRHAKEDSRRRKNRTTQDVHILAARRGQSTVDILEDELLKLRRKLEQRDAEMEQLEKEVSTLRIATANGSVQPQAQSLAQNSIPHEETSRLVNNSESVRSDASQLSCLDFSLAETGKLKTKITSVSTPRVNCEDRTDSILSDISSLPVEELSNVNAVSALGDVRGTTDGSASSSHVQDLDDVDKHVEGTKKSLDESIAEISKPDYLGDDRHDHTAAGDSKLPETVKEDLDISTQSYMNHERENIDANASRSPPKSTSSTEEPDFTFPTLAPLTCSDADLDSFLLHKDEFSMSRAMKHPNVHEIRDHEEVDAKPPLNFQNDDSFKESSFKEDSFKEVASSKASLVSKELTIEIPPRTEDPLKLHMKFCVMQEVNKLSKTVKSLQGEDSLPSSKHPDRISRSTSLPPLPCSTTAAAQSPPPHGGSHVPQRTLEWQSKSRTVFPKQPRPVTTSWKWREEEKTEPMAAPNCFDVEDVLLQRIHRRSSFAGSSSTSPQSRDYATKTTERRKEGLSPVSSPTSPSSPELSPSRISARASLLPDEPGRKPETGSSELVWQMLNSALKGEHSLEEIDIEEEVRQCLEQSRLLMSDATGSEARSEDKQSVPRPASREASFNVLALSRQRRNMEKTSTTSPRSRPEMHQQHQERPAPQEEEIISPRYVNHSLWDTQFGEVDIHHPNLDAEEENDLDYSVSSRPSLRDPVEASDRKYTEPSSEAGALDRTRPSQSSLPSRRTRFFTEANTPRFSQVA